MSRQVTVIETAEELAALASMESWQAEQKYEARRRRRKTTSPSLDRARATPARPRSLPSGQAFSWAGVALALLLLAAGALVLGFAVIGYVLLGMVQRLRGRG